METNTVLLIIAVALGAVSAVLAAVALSRASSERERREGELEALERAVDDARRELTAIINDAKNATAEAAQRSVRNMGETLLNDSHRAALTQEQRFGSFSAENEQKLENIRQTVERRLAAMQEDNNKKLDEMRGIVDEKLQKTLEARLTQSFALVNERLEQVYKGLGEMQTLAAGVGDLSKVLSNVKTRGILGEIQLGAILAEIMSPEQYLTDTPVKKGATERVEYAIKLPGTDGTPVLLPIDSKFPMDAYNLLADAYESGSPEAVKAAREQLRARVRSFAKDIKTKYICPPFTTDFAVMFLPTEGLYAEAVKLGMVESLQHDYRVNVAGPSTMAALLNSLQMGFRTLAIQKRSGEVWHVLSAVKTEFETFAGVLDNAKKKLDGVHSDLDKLIGTRTRKIRHSLQNVETLPENEAAALLERGAGALADAPDGDGEV